MGSARAARGARLVARGRLKPCGSSWPSSLQSIFTRLGRDDGSGISCGLMLFTVLFKESVRRVGIW